MTTTPPVGELVPTISTPATASAGVIVPCRGRRRTSAGGLGPFLSRGGSNLGVPNYGLQPPVPKSLPSTPRYEPYSIHVYLMEEDYVQRMVSPHGAISLSPDFRSGVR